MELSRLCEMQGISGREELVRMAIFRECAEVLGEENVKIDRTGNVIAHKACRKADAPRVMVAAHMDEVGLMVINAADDGLLQVRNIGGVDPRVLVSKRVKVGYDVPARDGKPAQEALSGVIGAMAIHLQSAADRKNVLPIENLYVDIGAKDKAEAEAKCPKGTYITFDTDYVEFGEGCVSAKALDDRVGCYTILELMRETYPCDVTFVFAVQEEVGCFGGKTAAYTLRPDIAIAVETTTAGDLAGVPEEKKVCRLGNGPVVSFMDRGTIYTYDLYKKVRALADAHNIPNQTKEAVCGGNESRSLMTAAGGSKVLAISIPSRYLHSPACVADEKDIENTLELLRLLPEALAL